jgi:hypothetical protein
MRTDRHRDVMLVAALIVGLLILLSRTVPGQAPAGKPVVKWEYRSSGILDVFGGHLDEELNKWGREGWELVTTTKPDPNDRSIICLFKRALP